MDYANILFRIQDGIGVITFNRPKALNALNPRTLEELAHAIERTRQDDTIRTLVLTGAGERAFVAGADITEFTRMNPLQARLFAEFGQDIFFRMEQLP
ncbi:MAG: enoyl-CoA hydratase-related protein, partial [Syntrophobacteraceae bacterium]